ncbi:tripartite tricarboxylate transporter permease [Nocardioides sp. B-3]|uniref:tripartite tricarboxylate transporter permease n=1 Tax=Nocardioides sp. B-3 TaxID=2895565 RepID=UPI0021539C0C|nr:tripartite tricarboxylate transporter permease [Nocardioides sp. B-3]
MDWNAFLDGFGVVTQPTNLIYCPAGVLIGMLIGVLPGLGPTATMAILLPIAHGAAADGTESRPSSCWPGSTTARSTAAPSRRSCCASPARQARW